MKFQGDFKFLNLQVIKKKNAKELKEDEQNFIKLNVLDKDLNPCSFFIFSVDLIRKILEYNFSSLSDLSISFELSFNNNNWHVGVIDIVGK